MLAAQVDAVLSEHHAELVRQVDAAPRSTVEAMGGLATDELVARLLHGLIGLGEMLEANLQELRRLIVAEQDSRSDASHANLSELEEEHEAGRAGAYWV